ncbi:hypothetical protein SLS64_002771 [Diaporthe eres]
MVVETDGAEGNEVPPGEEDELPPLGVGETREPVLLGVASSEEPVLVVNVEGAPELTVLGSAGKEVVVLGIDNERLVSELVVWTGVLGDTELREGVDTLVEPIVEVDRVDSVVIGEETVVLPRLEEPDVWVNELEELGGPLDVDVESFPDEMVTEESVDVTSVEEPSVPEIVGELTVLLLTVIDGVWLSVIDVYDTEEDCPLVSVMLVPDDGIDGEPLTLLVVDESTELSVFDPVGAEVPDENEDVNEDGGTLGLSSVLVVEATGDDDDS